MGAEEEAKEGRFKDPREPALKSHRGDPGDARFAARHFQNFVRRPSVAEFQNEVLSAIEEASPDVRNRILKRLKEAKALHQSIELH